MAKQNLTTLNLQTPLIDEVKTFIQTHPDFIAKHPELKNPTDFTDKAIRHQLEELQKNPQQKTETAQ